MTDTVKRTLKKAVFNFHEVFSGLIPPKNILSTKNKFPSNGFLK